MTSYCGGVHSTSERCVTCSNRRKAIARRGTGPRGQEIIARLEQPTRLSVLARELDITNDNAFVALQRLMRYRLVERIARGTYQRTQVRQP